MPETHEETKRKGNGVFSCCTPGRASSSSPGPEAAALADQLKALADPTRLAMLGLLARHGGEVCVCNIVEHFNLGQPTISHHLAVLREAGLVSAEKRGVWVHYSLNHKELMRVAASVLGLASARPSAEDIDERLCEPADERR